MPNKFKSRLRLVAFAVLLVSGIGLGWRQFGAAAVSSACLPVGARHLVCAMSDMARPARDGELELEHADFDISRGPLRLAAARNETVAFQFVVRTSSGEGGRLRLELTPPAQPGPSTIVQQVFQAHYVRVENGAYSWGPPTDVLPWPADYPDALIPATRPCQADASLFESVALAPAGANQAVWVDTYVGPETPAGVYTQDITLNIDGQSLRVPVELEVFEARLPDENSIQALGEIYGPYALEGVGRDISTPAWQAMAQCYQQLAHQHRTVFIERFDKGLPAGQLDAYRDTFGPALTGELFTPANAYTGPGAGVPVSVWRPPWAQHINVNLDEPLDQAALDHYEVLSAQWQELAAREKWRQTHFYAYVFDEVDGPMPEDGDPVQYRRYVAMAHEQMLRAQQAIDRGAPDIPIDLLWTSHSNPSQWVGEPDLNLVGKVRLWAPNASAADPAFLAERVAAGETAWFYHSGHPSIGAHSINASGIEMRTWGVAAARYGFQGQFMWALNLGSNERPFDEPMFRPDDDRVGNGVLVYPGQQLPQLTERGLPAAPGPIPSMRLKAWRRGLQDAELYYLAYKRDPQAAEQLIRAILPVALADADPDDSPSWSDDPGVWRDFHASLLHLASQEVSP